MEEELEALNGSGEERGTSIHRKIRHVLTETRVVLPGAQALLGFQLIITFTKTFQEIPALSKLVHTLSLGTMAVAIVLLMAPAAYHRLVYGGDDTEDMHRTGSNMITIATLPLALGIAGDVYVTIAQVAGSPIIGLVSALLALAMLIGLWHVYPMIVRARLSPAVRRRQAEHKSA